MSLVELFLFHHDTSQQLLAHRKRREGQQGSVKQYQVNIGYPIAKTLETDTSKVDQVGKNTVSLSDSN